VVTFFTIPKPFVDHIGIIQRNAIRNWQGLHPGIQVILMGNETGVATVAQELGCLHLPEIAQSEYGTPRVDAAFRLADQAALHSVLAYANADILFFRQVVDLVQVISRTQRKFLFTGHKWLVDVDTELSEEAMGAESALLLHRQASVMAGATGIDFFFYPRGQYRTMPPLIVGRPGWDNWMLFDSIKRRLPVIIPHQSIVALHQNHETGHVPDKKPGTRWEGPEAEFNRQSIGSSKILDFSLEDANYQVSPDGRMTARQADYQSNARKRKVLYPMTHWWRG
jgi:hypothetical protein